MAAAAAADSDPAAVATSTCAHCQREIPSSNIDLHSAHCARNLQKCEHCGEMVARKLMDDHYNENHAPDGDKFWRMPECYIRGNTIKYLRVPDEVIDKVQEETSKSRSDRKPPGVGRGRGRGDIGTKLGGRGIGRGQDDGSSKGGGGRGRGGIGGKGGNKGGGRGRG